MNLKSILMEILNSVLHALAKNNPKVKDIVGETAGNILNGTAGDIINETAGKIFGTQTQVTNNATNNPNNTNNMERITFIKLPTSTMELKAMISSGMKNEYEVAALSVAVLCNYEQNPEETFAMMDVLRGPDPLSTYAKQFIKDRLEGKQYKTMSFFEGATPQNNYTPSRPLTIEVSSNPYSYPEENWCTLYLKSGGADSPRPVKLRRKPSTGQWFVNDVQYLSDIRQPEALDPWS